MKSNFLWLLSLSICLLIWIFFPRPSNPGTFMQNHETGKSDIHMLLVGDSRSAQLQHFAEQSKQLAEKFGSTITHHIYFQNQEAFSTSCCANKPKPKEKHGFERHSFYAYGPQGHLVVSGKLHQYPGEILQDIFKKITPDKHYQLPVETGLSIADSILQDCEPILGSDQGVQCIFFQEDICFSCPSGHRLLKVEKMQKDHPDITFRCFLLSDYLPSLQPNLNEAGITIPVSSGSLEIKEYWRTTKEELGVSVHPMDGVFIVIRNEEVDLVTSDLIELQAWLSKNGSG